MWYRYSQNIDLNNTEELDPTKPKQTIPSGGALEVEITAGSISNINQNSPPAPITVKTSDGRTSQILLLHGIDSPSGVMFSIPREGKAGELYQANEDQFQEWMQKNYPGMNYIACHEGKAVKSQGADALINAAGAIQVGSYEKNGQEYAVFSE
ncbi:hypothetical protein EBU94_03410 [bacterium]|jgi:hypothetical protein|nr:hypothetical protein [bacterium]